MIDFVSFESRLNGNIFSQEEHKVSLQDSILIVSLKLTLSQKRMQLLVFDLTPLPQGLLQEDQAVQDW